MTDTYRELPKTGEAWMHFKNNLYRIICIATHTETSERFVIYQRFDRSSGFYARPLDMFMSEVDRTKYPNATQKYRFELVTDPNDVK